MAKTPALHRLSLTVHVIASVGWLGSVGAFLALSISAFFAEDVVGVRAAYISMAALGWWVIVPLSLASLLSGLVQGLITHWGLLRHYWVIAKLLINVLSTALLLLHMRPVSHLAVIARDVSQTLGEYDSLRLQVMVDAAAAVAALLIATALSVYKPRGLTRRGRRKLRELQAAV